VIEGDDTEALTEALVENLHREDMHPLDEADAYEKLQEWAKCSAAEVARRVGKEPRYVQQRLALHEKLSVKVKGAFRQGQINFTQARALSSADEEVQDIMLERVLGPSGSYYQTADSLERTVKYEQEAKQRRLEAASKPQPADSMFATPEEKAAHERQVAERERQEAEEFEAVKKQLAGMGAQEEEEARKAAQFNTLFRSALRDKRGRIARNALLDLLRPGFHQSLCSSAIGMLTRDSLGALASLLGIDAPPDGDERPPAEWFSAAGTAIIALDDGQAPDILLAMIAATATPAQVHSEFEGYYGGLGALRTYTAQVSSMAARALAEIMKVHVPAGMVPRPDDPEDSEEETDGEEQDPADEDAEEEEAA
jgi:ParB-like chromosome segregation protein Spo0J